MGAAGLYKISIGLEPENSLGGPELAFGIYVNGVQVPGGSYDVYMLGGNRRTVVGEVIVSLAAGDVVKVVSMRVALFTPTQFVSNQLWLIILQLG